MDPHFLRSTICLVLCVAVLAGLVWWLVHLEVTSSPGYRLQLHSWSFTFQDAELVYEDERSGEMMTYRKVGIDWYRVPTAATAYMVSRDWRRWLNDELDTARARHRLQNEGNHLECRTTRIRRLRAGGE